MDPVPTPADGEVGELSYQARHGDAHAQFRLAKLYDSGAGVPENPANAAKWYQKAAKRGHADAQFVMGELCATGDGLPKDPEEAATWYRRAAEHGHAKAQYRLSLMYAKGEGVPCDVEEALAWCSKAAEQGPRSNTVRDGRLRTLRSGTPSCSAGNNPPSFVTYPIRSLPCR
jgi:TPR repeat protein